MSKKQKYIDNLQQLERLKNLRSLPVSSPSGLVNLSSNDYLGLNENKKLYREFLASSDLEKLSLSASSTRLLTGNIMQYKNVEDTLSDLFDREACLVFNSGYHANMGILPAIADKRDLIIADKEVHASIIDAMQLSTADSRRYNHMSLDHLERILQKVRSDYENVFIVTESIFSMDGLKTDLKRLVDIKHKYNTYLYLDEAHAFGVSGPKGLGCAEEEHLIDEIDFIVGTFGKSLASIGAFVICDDLFKKYLVNRSRSLIYTTGLPPLNLAWTQFLLSKLPELNHLRLQIDSNWKYFSQKLNLNAESHIVPYILGNNHDVIGFADYMKNNGFYTLPIRHPTVPKGTARIRFSINASITQQQLEPLFGIFYKFKSNDKSIVA